MIFLCIISTQKYTFCVLFLTISQQSRNVAVSSQKLHFRKKTASSQNIKTQFFTVSNNVCLKIITK